MTDFFVEFIDLNEGVNFRLIFALIIGYIMTLWIIIVLWVYFDARKRYSNEMYPFVMGLATFFLGIPFLIFYLLIRPDKDDFDAFDYPSESPHRGGVNIPMINFVGEEGIEMTLNLTVSPKVKDVHPTDLKIDLNIEPSDTKFDVQQIEEVAEMIDDTKELEMHIKKKGVRTNVIDNLRDRLIELRKRLTERVKQKKTMKEETEIANLIAEKNKKKKKKKGKRK